VEVGSDSETCHAGVQAINIKVEELTDAEEEKCPMPITFPGIKVEDEVSCVCVYIFIHISEISSGEWNLRSPFKYIQED
jgi:hypothetical protein